MHTAAAILTSLVFLLHVYIVLLETVLFRTRGAEVFSIPKDRIEDMAPVMSNQGCYNLFLVAALGLGLFHPNPVIADAFTLFGLGCVIVVGSSIRKPRGQIPKASAACRTLSGLKL